MDRKDKMHSEHGTDVSSISSLLRKIIEAGFYNKEIMLPATSALIVLIILLWLNEIFNFPRTLLKAPSTPFNWQEAVLESLLVLAVWLVTLSIIIWNIYLRKEAERGLLESESRLREIIDFLPDPTFAIDIKGKVIVWNRAIEEMTGIRSQDMLGSGNYEYSFPFYQSRRPMLTDFVLRPDYNTADYYPLIRKENDCLIVDAIDLTVNGNRKTLWAKASRIFDIDNNTVGAIESIRDITELKKAEDALSKSETRFRTVADFTHDWEYWIRENGKFEYISPSCEHISGYRAKEFLENPGLMESIIHPDDRDSALGHFAKELERKNALSLDFRIITRSGENRWIAHACQPIFDDNGKFLGRRASNRDITARQILQEELLKAKKLEAIGVLAGGMAHDFNNLLSVILGNIEHSKMYVTPGSLVDRCLSDAREASLRSSELARLLLTFSKGGCPVKETGSIIKLIQNVSHTFSSGSNARVELLLPDDIWLANFDELQINQVIYSLISNSKEAIKEKGVIRIKAENVILPSENQYQLSAGKYIKVSVEDNGIGIPEGIIENIFDPYFSSKDMGSQKGMGMSLSICYSIIKKHGGHIGAKSRVGTGTTLYFFLPAGENTPVENQDYADSISSKSTCAAGKNSCDG